MNFVFKGRNWHNPCMKLKTPIKSATSRSFGMMEDEDPQVAPLKNLFPLFLLLRWPRPIVAAVVGFRVVHVAAVVVTIP